MKKLLQWAGAVALAFAPTLALAQAVTLPNVNTPSGHPTPAGASVLVGSNGAEKGTSGNPIYVSGGSGGGGDASAANQATQITAEQAIQATLGSVTASPTANTVSDRLKTLHADMVAPTPAGTNVIGKVGIDQTTPGTTNLVSSVGSRPFTGKFASPLPNAAASYTTNQVIAGVFAVPTGLPAGSIIVSFNIRVRARVVDVTTSGNLNFLFFDTNPTGSTLADAGTPSIALADVPKALGQQANAWVVGAAGGIDQVVGSASRIPVDSNGYIYIAIITQATNTFAAANSLYVEFDGTW